MLHFTSERERKLWIWALVVVLTIYATLGLAGTLAGVLRERGMLDVAFSVAFLLAVVAVVGSALTVRPGRSEMWAGLALAVVFGMVVVRMGIGPEERTHLFEYGLLGVLIHQALEERRRNGRPVPVPALLAVLVTSLLGWLDEGIQAVLPSRVYDIRDVGVNAVAAVMAVTAGVILSWVRKRTRS